MSWSGRSLNSDSVIQLTSQGVRITSVQYDGPALMDAVVVWSATCRALVAFSGSTIELGVQVDRVGALYAATLLTSRNVALGQRWMHGGVLIGDLLPGDVFGLWGGINVVDRVVVEANGLHLMVL